MSSMKTIDVIDRSIDVMIDAIDVGISESDRWRHPADVGLRCMTDHDPPMAPFEGIRTTDDGCVTMDGWMTHGGASRERASRA